MEEWAYIQDFPGYKVSSEGRVFGDRTQTLLTPSMNSTGSLKVNLMRGGQIHTRSVRVLVAQAFLPGYVPDAVPVHINGDPWNNNVDNLVWRPRWFAWKYARQFNDTPPREYFNPVVNLLTNLRYDTVMAAGVADALLWEYIYRSILTGRPVYPTGATFDFAD